MKTLTISAITLASIAIVFSIGAIVCGVYFGVIKSGGKSRKLTQNNVEQISAVFLFYIKILHFDHIFLFFYENLHLELKFDFRKT